MACSTFPTQRAGAYPSVHRGGWLTQIITIYSRIFTSEGTKSTCCGATQQPLTQLFKIQTY